MNSIEQYSIEEDTWKLLEIQIALPVTNFVSHALARDKVLILGTSTKQNFDKYTGELLSEEKRPVK